MKTPKWLLSAALQMTKADLTAKAVEGASLALESVHNVHRRHRLAASVFSVRDRVTDHVLKEHFENATGLLVDKARDALHATTESTLGQGGGVNGQK